MLKKEVRRKGGKQGRKRQWEKLKKLAKQRRSNPNWRPFPNNPGALSLDQMLDLREGPGSRVGLTDNMPR